MATAEHKTFNAPDETRPFEKGRVELLNIAGATIGRSSQLFQGKRELGQGALFDAQ